MRCAGSVGTSAAARACARAGTAEAPHHPRHTHTPFSDIGKLANGTVFDRSPKFSFRLGQGDVIKGWDVGVASMRVGGRRTLVIHPSFGYGKAGAPPDIPPSATLIFEVELKAI